jgi:inner membrane protein
LKLAAIRGEVMEEFRLKPGDAAGELRFSGESGKVTTQGVLEGMF